jgi:SAM-dependent methyltransferase
MNMEGSKKDITKMVDNFVDEYNSEDAILRYSKRSAGYGINYLLQNDYADIYLRVIKSNGFGLKPSGLKLLEFGCGAGMNIINLVNILKNQEITIEKAYGTDFSPVLIESAKREAKEALHPEDLKHISFFIARNEVLIDDISKASGKKVTDLTGTFDLILGVNTFRYCHRLDKSRECASDIFRLLRKGGVCIMIDMNRGFPLFRSKLRMSVKDTSECYLPSLEEYAYPFAQVGFQLLEKDNFCWIPHSAGPMLVRLCKMLSPLLNLTVRKHAMRSLIIAKKPL